MFQAYLATFRMLGLLRHSCPHSGILLQIRTHAESRRSFTYSCILRHFQNSWLIKAVVSPPAHHVRGTYPDGRLKVLTSDTCRRPSEYSQGVNTKTEDLMKNLSFYKQWSLYYVSILFFTGRTNIQRF